MNDRISEQEPISSGDQHNCIHTGGVYPQPSGNEQESEHGRVKVSMRVNEWRQRCMHTRRDGTPHTSKHEHRHESTMAGVGTRR